MAEFLHALPDDRGSDTTRRFFPESGDWRYARTVHLKNGGTRVQRWVIPAAQTSALFDYEIDVRTNPVLESLEINYEGQKLGLLLDAIMRTSDRWRLVRGNRFVPPRAPATSPTYVEWRKEGDNWVISAFGDEWFTNPCPDGSDDCWMPTRMLPEPGQPTRPRNRRHPRPLSRGDEVHLPPL